jgi:hypothetical protein
MRFRVFEAGWWNLDNKTRAALRPPTSGRWYFSFNLTRGSDLLAETTDFRSVVLQFQPNRVGATFRERPPTSGRWYFSFNLTRGRDLFGRDHRLQVGGLDDCVRFLLGGN